MTYQRFHLDDPPFMHVCGASSIVNTLTLTDVCPPAVITRILHQMQLCHHGGPTMYSEGPSHRRDDVPAAPPAMGDVMSMTADAMLAGTLSRLERSLGLDSAQSSQAHTPPEIQTPPRPGELSFRPPSTSSPRRRPISKLRPVDAREFP